MNKEGMFLGLAGGVGLLLYYGNKKDTDVLIEPDYLPKSSGDGSAFYPLPESDEGRDTLPPVSGDDSESSEDGGPGKTLPTFDYSSFEQFLEQLREMLEKGVSIQGSLNLGNHEFASMICARLVEIKDYIARGIASGFDGWGQDEFDRVNDFLRSAGAEVIITRSVDDARKALASLESYATEVLILVERAKANPAVVYGAPTLSFDAYEVASGDWESAVMDIKCCALTPNWSNMFFVCPRHRIGQDVEMYRSYAYPQHVGEDGKWDFTIMPDDPAAYLDLLRKDIFNPNRKLALDAERGATAFGSLGYDLNIMVAKGLAINVTSTPTVVPLQGYQGARRSGFLRCQVSNGVTTMSTYGLRPKVIELTIENPTIAKFKRFLGLGNIGNYDVFFLENEPEDSGEGFEICHWKAKARSSDITVTTHPWLFDEVANEMRVALRPQTYFTIGDAVPEINGRFFCVKRHGLILAKGLQASNIQFIGEYQSGIITPTLNYRVLETNKGIIIDVKSSSAEDCPLRAMNTLVLITKERTTLSFQIVEDSTALVVGKKKVINFQGNEQD